MTLDVERRQLVLPHSGRRTALVDWGGEGPVALLHHANGFCAAMWDEVAKGLRDRFHVVGMDARGHGDSEAPASYDELAWSRLADDVAAVAQQLREESGGAVALGLGHSFGGALIMVAASRHPGLFERVLCVDPVVFPRVEAPVDTSGRIQTPIAAVARRRRYIWASRDEARDAYSRKELFAAWTPSALQLYLDEGFRERADGRVELKCSPEVEAEVFSRPHSLDLFAEVEGLATPTRLLHATRSNFSLELYEALATSMTHGSVRAIDGGHLVVMEDPAAVLDAIAAFLEESGAS